MADRTRKFEFALVSDLAKLDLDAAARDFDHLADDVTDAGRVLDRFEDTARTVARRVDDAFDGISRSSRKTFDKDLDDDLDKAKRGLDDFKEEAHQSGREAAASFGGGFEDIGDFIQETAANAFGGFGPIGAAAGIAAAAGIGIITKAFGDAKERAEEAREKVSEWVQAYVDGLGTIQQATVDANLAKFQEDGAKKLREYSQAAKDAGVNVSDYLRAQAGDVEAQQRVAEQYKEQVTNLERLSQERDADSGALARQGAALQGIASDLGYTNEQMAEGKARADELRDALNRPISSKVTLGIEIPSPQELDRINRAVRSGIGTVVIPVRGQNPYTNNANNSRYRD